MIPNPPYNDEAEKSVISCAMQDPKLLTQARERLTTDCFYIEANQLVWRAMVHLTERYHPIDPVSLIGFLRNNNNLDRVGGSAAISELYTYSLPLDKLFAAHSETIVEKHAMRQIIAAAASAIEATRDPHVKASSILESTIAEMQRLATSRLSTADMLPVRPLSTIIDEVINGAEERSMHPGGVPGLRTGFTEIDQHTGGMQEGRLWVIAGETSDGKSSLVQNFIESACADGAAAAIYSYEMPDTECAERLICARGPIDATSFMLGNFTPESLQGLRRAIGEIKAWNLAVLDVADATIEQICRDITLRVAAMRRDDAKRQFVAAIDYLQLANTLERFDNRERAVAHISKTAKMCAKKNKCTILMPSQLNDDGKLRESRAIGHDADVALKIQKPKDAKKGEISDEREIFCGKNRGGKRNWSIEVKLEGRHFRFSAR